MARRVNPRPILNQARLAANVKYGPEESGLRNLAAQALSDLTSGIQIQRGVRVGIQTAVRALRQPMTNVYTQAIGNVNDAAHQLNADLSVLNSSADAYRGAAAREQFMARARLAGAMTDSLKELDNRSVQAGQGEQFADTNLQNQYATNVGRIRQRQQDLAVEKGNYIAAEYGKQYQAEQTRQDQLDRAAQDRSSREAIAAANRGVAVRGQNLAHTDRIRGQNISAGKGKGGGGKGVGHGSDYQNSYTAAYNWLWNQRAYGSPGAYPFGPTQQINNVIAAVRQGTGSRNYNAVADATAAFLRKFPINRHPTAKLR